MSDELNALVLQRVELSPDLMILRVAADGWTLPDFIPGQYAVLGLPGSAPRCPVSDVEEELPPDGRLIRRAYSIASSSLAREYLEFFVTLVRSGTLTPRLFALEPGSRVHLGPKVAGVFSLAQVPEDRHLVLLATGTGVAPYVSMLRTHLVCGAPRRFAVLLGARHSWDLGYHAELSTLQRLCPNLAYLPTISRPDEELVPWRGHRGYIQDLWQARSLERTWEVVPTPENSHVFLCGNPKMVEDMQGLLALEGFTEFHPRRAPEGQVHTEKYW